MAILEAGALAVEIGGRRICNGLDLRIEAGQRWAILGTNGAGKTTLLQTLAGLRPAASGRLTLHGRGFGELPRRTVARAIGLLPQDHEDAFPATVFETAMVGRHPHIGGWGWESDRDRHIVHRALDEVGLGRMHARPVTTLSGGERRRLGLASLVAQEPEVFLLDEPDTHLDVRHRIGLLGALARRVAHEGRAWLMVTHDPTLALRLCDQALMLYGDGTVDQGPAGRVLSEDRLTLLFGHPMRRLQGPAGPIVTPA